MNQPYLCAAVALFYSRKARSIVFNLVAFVLVLMQAPGESASAAKKTKAAAGGDGGAAIDWAAIAEAGAVQKQTVDTLKQFCRDRGLTTTGKKSDLVARVLDALGSA